MLRALKRTLFIFATLFLISCTIKNSETSVPEAKSPISDQQLYRQAALQPGNQIYIIDNPQSLLTIKVFRGGPLARLGHDHIITSRDIRGFVLINERQNQCRADLVVPLDKLTVDEPQLRREAGFDSQPSAEDIEGTKNNMLEKVLQVEEFPLLKIALRECPKINTAKAATATITLKKYVRTMAVPLTIKSDKNNLLITGETEILQSDFGLQPFSVMGGLLQVSDNLEITFRIVLTAASEKYAELN